jgi:predicted Zn-dependent peptidase
MNRALMVWAGWLIACSVAAGEPAKVRVEFKESTLRNGLRVQLAEDHVAPVVAVNIAYDVGSHDETQGLTGFAHLFEHMMFKGSANVGDGEHFYQVFTNGGTMNGTTGPDVTLYFETMPANQLELMLFLEADRMRSLEITQENLDNQRQAVQEERRLRVDNQPYGPSDERMGELFYDNFAYKHSVIGSMQDLNAASIEDVSKFFKTYYAPNNAVLTLVGNFKSADALRLIRKHFEDIPRQAEPPPVDLTEPSQKAERREQPRSAGAAGTVLDTAKRRQFASVSEAQQRAGTGRGCGRICRRAYRHRWTVCRCNGARRQKAGRRRT